MFDKSPLQEKYLMTKVGKGYKLPTETMTPKEYGGQRLVLSKHIVLLLTFLMSKEEQEEFLAVDDCNNNKEYKF